ncbi:MAG: hypothetical protein ABJC88_16920 [Parasphingorhabdus sp.]|uniref:hypothetical protein n=1 Tax=Sphingomonadales TaxID=204457 RepID=UPI00326707FD
MSNYSTLTQNTLAGLGDMAGALYLDLLDIYQGHSNRSNEKKAFLAACDFDERGGGFLDYVLDNSPVHNLDRKAKVELSEFMAKRYRINFMEKKA